MGPYGVGSKCWSASSNPHVLGFPRQVRTTAKTPHNRKRWWSLPYDTRPENHLFVWDFPSRG
jgi:hypothetical protein